MRTEEEIFDYIFLNTGFYINFDDEVIIINNNTSDYSWSIWTCDFNDYSKDIGSVMISPVQHLTKKGRLRYLNDHLEDICKKCKDIEKEGNIFYDFI